MSFCCRRRQRNWQMFPARIPPIKRRHATACSLEKSKDTAHLSWMWSPSLGEPRAAGRLTLPHWDCVSHLNSRCAWGTNSPWFCCSQLTVRVPPRVFPSSLMDPETWPRQGLSLSWFLMIRAVPFSTLTQRGNRNQCFYFPNYHLGGPDAVLIDQWDLTGLFIKVRRTIE